MMIRSSLILLIASMLLASPLRAQNWSVSASLELGSGHRGEIDDPSGSLGVILSRRVFTSTFAQLFVGYTGVEQACLLSGSDCTMPFNAGNYVFAGLKRQYGIGQALRIVAAGGGGLTKWRNDHPVTPAGIVILEAETTGRIFLSFGGRLRRTWGPSPVTQRHLAGSVGVAW